MRAAVERFARRWWAGELGAPGRALSLLAAPVAWAWSGAHTVRARAHGDHAPTRVEGLRVISVGNLAVGGTGKTPLAGWIAGELDAAGVPTCVLVGGAGEDEALLHRRWNPRVPVIVGSDRVAGAESARTSGARVVVLDDGFQHVRLARDLNLVLLSVDDPFPGAVLPRGPYREAPCALGRADGVLLTRRAASAEQARELAALLEREWPGLVRGGVHLADGLWTRLDGTTGEPRRGDVLAVCGVARPDAFAASVRRRVDGAVELVAFADHHGYTRDEAATLRRRAGVRPIVLTEKDAVKLVKLVRMADVLGEAFVLRDRLAWDWGEESVRTWVRSVAGEGVRA